MTPDTPALSILTRRLDALERENRRLQCILLVIVLTAAGVAATAQSVVIPSSAHVRTERLTLIDADNRTRAVLELSPQPELGRNPVLTFYDQDGRRRVRIGVSQSGPLMQTFDEENRAHEHF